MSTLATLTEGALYAGSLPTLGGISLGFLGQAAVSVPAPGPAPSPTIGNPAVGYVGRPAAARPAPGDIERRARYVAAAVGVSAADEEEREAARIAAAVALELDDEID